MPGHLSRSRAALAELALLLLPGLPAYLWLWPRVKGSAALIAEIAVLLYFLAGSLFIGLRRWSLGELGLNRRGVGLSLACGLALVLGRTLVLLGVSIPFFRQHITPLQMAFDVVYLFALVGFVQELLIRGLLYRALEEWRGPRAAIWGSALAFGLYHIGQGPLGALGGLIYGLVFGAIRWRAGGIVGLAFVHGLVDITGLWMLPTTGIAGLGRPQILHPLWVLLGCALILAVPLYLWWLHPRCERSGAPASH